MHDLLYFVRIMLRSRRLLALTLGAALLDALCAAGGFGLLTWAVQHLLGEGASVRKLASESVASIPIAAIRGAAESFVGWIPERPFRGFLWLLGAIFSLTLLGSVFRVLYQYGAVTLTFRTVMRVRAQAFQRLVHLPLELIMERGTADMLSRVVRDCSAIVRGLNALLGKALRDALIGLAALAVAFWIDFRLTLLFVVGLPVLGLLLHQFGRKIRKATRRAMKQYGRMLATMQEALQAIRVIKVHQAEGFHRRRFHAVNRAVWQQERNARLVRAISSPAVELLGITGVMGVAIVVAWMIYENRTEPADLINVVLMLALAGGSLRPLANLNNDLQESAAAASRVHEILGLPVEPGARGRPDPAEQTLPPHRVDVVFDAVSYRYPSAETDALSELSFRVPFGARCAIVGPNGSGKSTLLALLPRLIEPTDGAVRVDGRRLGDCTLRSIRAQTAMVTQETVLFDGTIAENVALGRAHTPRERIVAAAADAHADEFVEKLPQGYDTPLGEWGHRLSGGQRQRLAIARALLRDPSLLILDEATSQIDKESEARIHESLKRLTAGRTSFIVAHRLETVRDADLILVLDQGRLVDSGTHDELLGRCELYRLLAEAGLRG